MQPPQATISNESKLSSSNETVFFHNWASHNAMAPKEQLDLKDAAKKFDRNAILERRKKAETERQEIVKRFQFTALLPLLIWTIKII